MNNQAQIANAKRTVRLVGGEYAGQELDVDLAKSKTLRLPKHPDFAVCNVCARPEELAAAEPHYEEYDLHKVPFRSGHSHVIGVLSGKPLVSAFNDLWFEYQKAKDTKP